MSGRGRGGRSYGGRGRGYGSSRGRSASRGHGGSKRTREQFEMKDSIHTKLPKTAVVAYAEMRKSMSEDVAVSAYVAAVADAGFAFPSNSMHVESSSSSAISGTSSASTSTSTSSSASDAMHTESTSPSSSYDPFARTKKIPGHQISLTQTTNGSPSLSSSRSFICDIFYRGFVRFCSESDLRSLLRGSWSESPELTLQCLHHSRDCRAGKGEKLVSMHALLWLREYKPMTYLLNLADFVYLGYYKDLLALAVEVEKRKMKPLGVNGDLVELEMMAEALKNDQRRLLEWQEQNAMQKEKADKDNDNEEDKMKEERLNEKDVDEQKKAMSSASKEEKKDKIHIESIKTSSSPSYHGPKLSLAGKWAPTSNTHYDKAPHFYAKRIAKLVFPYDKRRLRAYRILLSDLRRHLNVVERLICRGQWLEVDFSHVPARAHALLKKAFQRHTPEKYEVYLQALDRNDGTARINTTGLQPHELVKKYLAYGAQIDATIEAPWNTIVEKLKVSGALQNCLSLVDVSGSMDHPNQIPMSNSIALGILTSLLTAEPFHRKILTFTSEPSLFPVEGTTLFNMVQHVRRAPWGGSTNVDAAIELILQTALKNNVRPEDMPKTLFIYSDMQFDTAAERPNISNYDRKTAFARFSYMYGAAGYKMPEIVFWNLNGSTKDVPVAMNAEGVALMSGFSSELLKMFLQGELLSPLAMVVRAVHLYPHEVEESERQDTGEQKEVSGNS